MFLDARLMYDDDKLFRVINVSPHNRKVGSMKRLLVSDLIRKTFPALSVTVLCWTSSLSEAQTFLRGDADGSGVYTIGEDIWRDALAPVTRQSDVGIDLEIYAGGDGWIPLFEPDPERC